MKKNTQYQKWIYGFFLLCCTTVFTYSCVKEKFEPLKPLEGLALKPNQIELEEEQSVAIQIIAVPENSVNKNAFYIEYSEKEPKVRAEVTEQGKTLKVTGLEVTDEEIWLIWKENETIKAKIQVQVQPKGSLNIPKISSSDFTEGGNLGAFNCDPVFLATTCIKNSPEFILANLDVRLYPYLSILTVHQFGNPLEVKWNHWEQRNIELRTLQINNKRLQFSSATQGFNQNTPNTNLPYQMLQPSVNIGPGEHHYTYYFVLHTQVKTFGSLQANDLTPNGDQYVQDFLDLFKDPNDQILKMTGIIDTTSKPRSRTRNSK